MTRASPLVWAGAAVGLSALLVAALLLGARVPGGAGAGGVPISSGGLTINSLQCNVPVSGTTYPTGCVMTATVNQGAQAATVTLNGDNIGGVAANPLTMTGSITISAGQPVETASYPIVPQPVNVRDYSLFFLGHNYNSNLADFYNPGATAKQSASVTPNVETCTKILNRPFDWDVESIENYYFTGTWFLYLCGEHKDQGQFGTLSTPQIGQEVTLGVGSAQVKVGNGRVGAAPSSATLPGLGASTVTWTGALATGAAVPATSDYAAVWMNGKGTWQIIPNGLYTNYPLNSAYASLDSTIKASYMDTSGPGAGTGNNIDLAPVWGGIAPGDLAILSRVSSLDSGLITLRQANAALAAITQSPATFPLDLQKSVLSNKNQPSAVVTLTDSWGNAQLVFNLDGTAVQSLGIHIAVGVPKVVSVSGSATTGAGGSLSVQVQNTGTATGSFQVTATCPGITVTPATVSVSAGQSLTVPLAVQTGVLASTQAVSCTATATDMGSGASDTLTGTLQVTQGGVCISGQIQINGQNALQCQGGQWVTYLPCPAGTTVGGSGTSLQCVPVTQTGAVGPVPAAVPGGVAGGVATAQPISPGPGDFVHTGPPWWVLPLVIVAVAGIIGAAIAFSRRRPPMGGM